MNMLNKESTNCVIIFHGDFCSVALKPEKFGPFSTQLSNVHPLLSVTSLPKLQETVSILKYQEARP